MKKYLNYLLGIAISEGIGILGGVFTSSEIPRWYTTITKPSFNPPSWVFGPVWTILFLLIGISLGIILNSPKSQAKTKDLYVAGIQLALNFLWSLIFFKFHSTLGATTEIGFLILAIIINIATFSRISQKAAWLLAPYLIWVSFASLLTFSIWRLN